MAKAYIGIDVGGTNIKVGCFDANLNLLGNDSVSATAYDTAEPIVDLLAEAAKGLLSTTGLSVDDLAGVGLGMPGPDVDYDRGIVYKTANLPQFHDTHLNDMVSERLGGKPAFMDNDANVACWGEFKMGAGKEVDDMVFFTLGTGIGGGIVSHGQLIKGSTHAAAELGHLILYPNGRQCGCGQRGCVEAYASASTTAARAMEALQSGQESSLQAVLEKNGEVTSKDIVQHAKNGDALAVEIIDGTAEALGLLCVNTLHTTDPAMILFSGGMIAAGEFLLNKIQKAFDEFIWPVRNETVEIAFATLGEDTGIIGAAALAKHPGK